MILFELYIMLRDNGILCVVFIDILWGVMVLGVVLWIDVLIGIFNVVVVVIIIYFGC